MTPTEMITRLYSLGHFHNPAMPTGVTLADLPNLQLHDAVVRTAIKSYQTFFKPALDKASLEAHSRLAVVDGDVGPATDSILNMVRCGFPDYPYPEGVLLTKQEANWPTACRGNLKFIRNFASLPGLSAADTDKVFHAMSNNWTYALEDVGIVSSQGNTGEANIYAGLKQLGGSTLAWSFLAQNSCTNQLEQAYDNDRTWSIKLATPTASHEVGHALGLEHTQDSDSLMYPAITNASMSRRGWPNATDLAQCKAKGYRLSGKSQPEGDDLFLPRPHTPTDPTDPTPPSGKLRFTGEFTAMIDDKEFGKFILTPKPEA